jgi:hypothetical protein
MLLAPLTLLTLLSRDATAAPVTEKTPGLDAPATTPAGTVDFLLSHDFSVVGPKVISSPTFLLDGGIVSWASIGARYASRSTIDTRPNELEAIGKISAVSRARGQPIDLTILGGYDTAANSGVGELLLAGEIGPLGLLGAARGFTAAYGYGGATGAFAIGARVRLTPYLAIVSDLSHVVASRHWDRIKDASNRFGWSAGLAFVIPYSPHSFSVYATNLNSHTLLESSRGLQGWLMGFEFDVPFDSGKRWAAIFSPPHRTAVPVAPPIAPPAAAPPTPAATPTPTPTPTPTADGASR